MAVTMSEQATVTAQVSFADQPESCSLYVTHTLAGAESGGAGAGADGAVAAADPAGLFAAVRLRLLPLYHAAHRAAQRHRGQDGAAGLSLGMRRAPRDEIGQLGRSLDEMARRLSAALAELESANRRLRREVSGARPFSPPPPPTS